MAVATSNSMMSALVQAVFKSKPPVMMGGVKIDAEPDHIQTVTVTFAMTPELVQAWGDECKAQETDMAASRITIKVTLAWWLPLYVRGVAMMCALTGMEPDWEKVESVIHKAMRLKLE